MSWNKKNIERPTFITRQPMTTTLDFLLATYWAVSFQTNVVLWNWQKSGRNTPRTEGGGTSCEENIANKMTYPMPQGRIIRITRWNENISVLFLVSNQGLKAFVPISASGGTKGRVSSVVVGIRVGGHCSLKSQNPNNKVSFLWSITTKAIVLKNQILFNLTRNFNPTMLLIVEAND